jgi:hypothetical protein
VNKTASPTTWSFSQQRDNKGNNKEEDTAVEEKVLLMMSFSVLSPPFLSRKECTEYTYRFLSLLRGKEMAAQRDAFPTDWDTCGIVTLFILLFSSSGVCLLVNIFLVAVNRPAHPALTFRPFSLLQMDDASVTQKKNQMTRRALYPFVFLTMGSKLRSFLLFLLNSLLHFPRMRLAADQPLQKIHTEHSTTTTTGNSSRRIFLVLFFKWHL